LRSPHHNTIHAIYIVKS